MDVPLGLWYSFLSVGIRLETADLISCFMLTFYFQMVLSNGWPVHYFKLVVCMVSDRYWVSLFFPWKLEISLGIPLSSLQYCGQGTLPCTVWELWAHPSSDQ